MASETDLSSSLTETQTETQTETDESKSEISESAVLLSYAWQNEKNSPCLLRCEISSMECLRNAIENREDHLAEMNEQLSDKLIEKKKKNDISDGCLSEMWEAAQQRLFKLELTRLRYLLGAYCRIRLQKVQKFALHISANPEEYVTQGLISDAELKFAVNYAQLWHKHFKRTFLDELPQEFSGFGESDMQSAPDMDEFVFVQPVETIDSLLLEGSTAITMPQNTVHCLRFAEVKNLIYEGKADCV